MNIGIWYFLVSLFKLFNNQLGAVIVGLAYGVASITGFSIATRMVGYATTIVVSGTGVLAPMSSIFQSRSEQNRLNALFINGNLYCWSIALFAWGGCVFFGESLIVLWMGDEYRFTSYLLVILITGEAIPIAQLVTASVLQGMGKQKALAICGIFEISGIVLLNYVSAGPFGLVGVCYAFAIPALCTRGIAQMIIGCRAVGLPLKQYIIQVLLFSILPAIVPCAMAFAYTYYMSINSWFEFVAASIVYTLVFFASFRYRWIRR